MSSKLRAVLGSSTLALALVFPVGVEMTAADDPAAAASLCDLVDLSGLNARSGLAFERALDEPSICNLVSPADEGFHSLQLATRPGALEDVRQGDSSEVTLAGVGGLATVIDGNAEVYVDLGAGRLLRVGVTAGAPGSSGLEPLELGLAIAETAGARLGSSSSGDPSGAEAEPSARLAPPAVEGLDLGTVRFEGDGPTLQDEQPGMAGALAPLLEAAGTDAASLTVYQADSGGQSTAPGYQAYLAVRVAGVDAGTLGPALLAALGLVDGPDFEVVESELGGKAVVRVTAAQLPDAEVYVYDAGDTAYLLQLDEEIAARLLQALS
jgi:hypothetical protein